jgi:hypothetical protein
MKLCLTADGSRRPKRISGGTHRTSNAKIEAILM